MRTRIKICCILSLDEARLAIDHGADALGLVSAMPSGPGVIDEATIAAIAAAVPPPIATFLLTSETEAESIIAQARRCRPTTLQLVDAVEPSTYAAIRLAVPFVSLVQVIHVIGETSLAEAQRVAPYVDALLLDSGNPNLAVKELGGTGRVHDWSVSRAIRDGVDKPVFLAGGLRPDNVGDAIARVAPFGLDLCSGVRTDGRLDATKLERFVTAARRLG